MAVQNEVKIPYGDSSIPASLALPESGDGPWPCVVVIHEITGLNDDIRRIARRFADSGYVALAPDLFAGLGPRPICIARTVADYRRGGSRSLTVLEAAKAFLSQRPDVDGSRIGVAGFCMGGGFALLMGTTGAVHVAATFYGDTPREAGDLEGICPVIASYGSQDRIFARRGRRLERFLSQLGVPHDLKLYEEAGHSFMSRHTGLTGAIGALGPLRARYVESAAEDSWARMFSFFEEHLRQTQSEPPSISQQSPSKPR
jgi:carboxymethylenebutenolidase